MNSSAQVRVGKIPSRRGGRPDAAISLGRRPILEVWTELDAAIELYERAGWLRLGKMTFTFTSPCRAGCLIEGDSLQSLVYAVRPVR